MIKRYQKDILTFRKRSIESFCEADVAISKEIFNNFEMVLGPVGAAKSLHLLAPFFFPIWDRSIAKKYGPALKQKGSNSAHYLNFIEITKKQCEHFGSELKPNPLKALDEYNYAKYTKGWI